VPWEPEEGEGKREKRFIPAEWYGDAMSSPEDQQATDELPRPPADLADPALRTSGRQVPHLPADFVNLLEQLGGQRRAPGLQVFVELRH